MTPSAASDGPAARPDQRRTQKQRRDTTERRVLDAATRLVAARGSRSISVAQVGAEAGYSRGIVNHHFGTRDAMLRAVAEHAQKQFEVPPNTDQGLTRLLKRTDGYLVAMKTLYPTGQAFLLMWAEAVASEPTLRPIFIDRDEYFRGEIAADIRRGVGDGSMRSDADAEALAVVVVGQVRGIGMQLMLTPEPTGFDRIRSALADMLTRTLKPDG